MACGWDSSGFEGSLVHFLGDVCVNSWRWLVPINNSDPDSVLFSTF